VGNLAKDDNQTAFWEPWQPEVGQRVRVLSRPECFYCREDEAAEAGAAGVVTSLKESPYLTGSADPGEAAHHIWVQFDDPMIATRTVHGCQESHFAAAELAPLDDN
jgi:hypothetical protein